MTVAVSSSPKEGVHRMSSTSWRRSYRYAVAVLALLGALVVPASATATTETFRFFEVNAQANYTIIEQCADGTTRTLRVTVIGGHEEEQVNGETTTDEDFLTVLLRGATCENPFINDRAFGTGEFTFSPSLQTASVTGTVISRDGRTIDVEMSWEGTGPIETTQNTTIFPGFVGHFTGKERDAVATGTVVVDGETIVNGSTTNASIETLEDNNTRTGQG
jgi:hypothetical protein